MALGMRRGTLVTLATVGALVLAGGIGAAVRSDPVSPASYVTETPAAH